MSHNNSNNNKNPFGDLPQEDSPWNEQQVPTNTSHSAYNPFTSPEETLITSDNYSPSTNDLIDLQQDSTPQIPTQIVAASSSLRNNSNGVNSTHYTHEGKKVNKHL